MKQPARWLSILLGLQLIAIGLIAQHVLAATNSVSSGTFVSPTIGTPYVTKFLTFVPTGQVVPDGTSITYSFAGSATNYATWSPEIASQKIDLTGYSQLANSHYMKVRITMNSTADVSPSLAGFQVTYDTTVETPTTATAVAQAPATTAATTPPAPAPTTQATTSVAVTTSPSASASASASPTASNSSHPATTAPSVSSAPKTAVTSHVVTLADTQKVTASSKVPISTLVSTGSNLWVNLLIALLLSAATTWWFLLRHLHALRAGDSASE